MAHAQGLGYAAVGPVDPANGYPTSFTDTNGLALAPCLVTPNDPANPIVDPCGLTGTLPGGDSSAIVFPSNFPAEFFYSRAVGRITGVGTAAAAGLAAGKRFPKFPAAGADATPAEILARNLALAAKGGGGGGGAGGRADLVIGLEGSFTNGVVQVGQQVIFARLRIKITGGLVPGATYTVTHPFGTATFVASSTGTINFTDDQGCLAAPCGDFSQLLTVTNQGPFLQWDATGVKPPAGYVGDPNVTHSIVGSPFGTNVFRIDGPNVGGIGVNTIQTNQFAITGKPAQ